MTVQPNVRDAVAALRADLLGRLAERIRHLGLTQVEAARLIGADQPTLSKALSGRPASLSIDRLVAWLAALGEAVVLAGEADAERKRIEERALLVQEAGGVGSVDWDIVADRAVVSPRFLEIYGLPDDTPRIFASWLGRVHPEDRGGMTVHIRDALKQGGHFGSEYRIVRADTGEVRWISSRGVVFHDEAGRAVRLVSGHVDVTDRKRAEAELQRSEWHFRTIFEQANDYIFTSDLNQIVTTCNPSVAAALGLSQKEIVGRSFADFIDPDQFEQTSSMLRKKLAEGGTTRHTVRVRAPAGGHMIWEINSRLILDESGRPHGLHAIARDVTEAKRAEEHQQLLINELNHRVKNMLAIVQGLAQQSFRGDAASAEAQAAFTGRLSALAAAHSLLTRHNWTGASLLDVVEQALAPHRAGLEHRFKVEGCPLPLPPKSAVSLAMAMHELATNAAKYGALSNDAGRVAVRWSVSEGEAPRLHLRWAESGGPAVAPPSRRGFGTRMIERSLAVEFGGAIRFDFHPAGLICEIDAPVAASAVDSSAGRP